MNTKPGVDITSGEIPPELQRHLLDLHSVWDTEEDRARRKEAENRLRVYQGDAEWMIRPMPHESGEHFRLKPKFAPPLLRHAIRMLSYLYDVAPERESTQSEDVWRDRVWEWGDGLDGTMGDVDSLVRLLGTVHMLPLYSPAPGIARDVAKWVLTGEAPEVQADAWGVEAVVYTPDCVVAAPNRFDCRYADAVMLRAARYREEGDKTGEPSELWHVWTDDHFCMVRIDGLGGWRVIECGDEDEKGAPVYAHPNMYGQIPAAECREPGHSQSYWGRPWGGRDLLNNLRAVYEIGTEYLHAAKLQRGQPVYTGESAPNGAMAPDSAITVKEGETFTIIPNAANLDGMREAFTTALEVLSKTMGLPSRTFRLDDSQAMSGFAIEMDRAELDDDRKARVRQANRWETAYHQRAALVVNEHHSTGLDASTVTQEFAAPGMDPRAIERIGPLWDRGMPMRTISDWLDLGVPEYTGDEVGYVPGSALPSDVATAETAEDL